MQFAGINYIAVIVAAIGAFGFGAVWYMTLAKPWMAAVGFTEQPKQTPQPYVVAIISHLIMAYFLAGLIGHLGDVSAVKGATVAFFVWLAFVATTLSVNHRFQDRPWSLTIIDGGHWLGVMLVQGVIIGLFGA